jgi:hypothetical protein
MTRIDIDGLDLVLHVEGWDKFFALKSELRVPLAHVAAVERASDEAHRWFHGFRAAGTNIPGVLTAGTFWAHEGHVFWDVHDPDRAIAIRLHDESYVKLVVEVADPGETITAIESALAHV